MMYIGLTSVGCKHFNIKGFIFMVHVTLVKPNVMQMLDGMNIIIQLKVQNHQNTFETTSTTILHGLSFQMFQKMLRPEKLKSIIYCSKQKDFEKLVLFRNGVTKSS